MVLFTPAHGGFKDDPAWCYKCNRDTAFCLCICYECYEQLEDCQCTCAQCDKAVPGGGLCPEHKSGWNKEASGPIPGSSQEVGICAKCGVPFNKAFLLNAPSYPKIQTTAYITDRTCCLSCDPNHVGKWAGYKR